VAANSYLWGDFLTFGFSQQAAADYGTYATASTGLHCKPVHFPAPGSPLIKTEHSNGHRFLKTSEVALGVDNFTLPLDGAVPKANTAFGYLLETIFDELTGDVYTIATGDSKSVSLAIIDNLDDGKAWTGTGGKLSNLTISVKPNEYLMFSGTLVGTKPERNQDAPTITYSDAGTTNYYTFDECSFTIGGAPFGVDSFECAITTNLFDDETNSHEIGSTYRKRLVVGRPEVIITIDRVITATALFDVKEALTNQALVFTATEGGRTLIITAAKCKIVTWETANADTLGQEHIVLEAMWESADPDDDFSITYDVTPT